MSEWLQAIVLGVIEGLTEFLPVSSTGHMLLAQPLLGVDPALPVWRVFLFVSQLGAIAAVVVYFWRDLWQQTVAVPRAWRDLNGYLPIKLLVAMVPTVLLALLLEDWVESHLETQAAAPPATAAALIAGALIMFWIDRRCRRETEQTLRDVTLRQALGVGLIQVLSMWPGVSRAAATILGGMVLGLSPRVATQFSFYLAIPTMLAAGGWRILKHHNEITRDVAGVVAIGTAVAFVVALAVVAWFMEFVRRKRFTLFVVYRIVLGAAVLTWYLLKT